VTERFRLAGPVAFWWLWVAFVAANVADFAVQGLPSAHFGAVLAAFLLLVTGLAYALALRPRVIADDGGITVVNPLRTHVIPWRLVTLVDTGEWVRVHYAAEPVADAGAGGRAGSAGARKVDCWALYVSRRAQRKIALGVSGSGAGLAAGLLARAARAGESLTGPTGGGARLSAEARYLSSLPAAQAMAVRLDSRADRERARRAAPAAGTAASAAWYWPAIAAMAVPALLLLAVSLA